MARRAEGRHTIWPFLCCGLVLLVSGCDHTALKPDPQYVLGKPYQVRSLWLYPRESYDFDETGLAAVSKDNAARLTANGEMFDQTALAAAHPSLQLPAIARLTNLENGLETTVRINDRGLATRTGWWRSHAAPRNCWVFSLTALLASA